MLWPWHARYPMNFALTPPHAGWPAGNLASSRTDRNSRWSKPSLRAFMMPTSISSSLLLGALATCAASTVAQDPIEALDAQILKSVEERLAADSPQQVAWGGYLAQRYRLRGASRALCAALDRWKHQEGLEARMTRLHLLDGLLGIGARVPTEQVEFLLNDKMTRAATLAVMAQDAAANLEGLARLAMAPAEWNDMARKSAARLLVARGLRSTRLGWHVVDNIKCGYSVWLTDGNGVDSSESEAAGGRMVKYLLTKTQAGFPPLVRIDLTSSQNAEAMVKMVVPGRVGEGPIYLTRQEKAVYRPIDMEFGRLRELPSVFERLNLLKQMSGVRNLQLNTFRELHWTDAATFLSSYTKERDEIRAQLDLAIRQMRKKGWLGNETRPDFRIPLSETIEDMRGETAVALPEIPAPAELGK